MLSTRPRWPPFSLSRIGPLHRGEARRLGLSDVLRAELEAMGAPVGVSVVMPGMIRTGMNPVGLVEPSSVARNVLDAMRRRRPYVFTDDHSTEEVDARLRADPGGAGRRAGVAESRRISRRSQRCSQCNRGPTPALAAVPPEQIDGRGPAPSARSVRTRAMPLTSIGPLVSSRAATVSSSPARAGRPSV